MIIAKVSNKYKSVEVLFSNTGSMRKLSSREDIRHLNLTFEEVGRVYLREEIQKFVLLSNSWNSIDFLFNNFFFIPEKYNEKEKTILRNYYFAYKHANGKKMAEKLRLWYSKGYYYINGTPCRISQIEIFTVRLLAREKKD